MHICHRNSVEKEEREAKKITISLSPSPDRQTGKDSRGGTSTCVATPTLLLNEARPYKGGLILSADL